MFRAIKTFFAMPFSHKLLFVKISILIPITETGIRILGFKRTYRVFAVFQKSARELPERPLLIIGRHMNLSYLFTKNFPFLGNCLAQCMSLWLLLKRNGIETDLKFGMKKESGQLLAHAWLEYDGKPLASQAELEQNYTFFTESLLRKIS